MKGRGSVGSSASKRVLLVDDDAAVLKAFRKALRKAGYEVMATKSSDVAMARLSTADPGDIDLAVIDIFLGGQTSGFQLARRVADLQPDAGIVVISGLLGEEVPRHSLPRSRLEFLKKPVDVEELIRTARRLSG